MSELERLGVDIQPPRSIQGAGLTRTEATIFNKMSDPSSLINNVIKTEGYGAMNDNEKKLSLQLITDQFIEDAEAKVFDTKRDEFRDLRQRIRESK